MPTTPFESPLRRIGALLAVSASGLAIGACGGGEETTASTSSSSSGAAAGESSSANDQDAARVRLQQCLRENGVDIPDDAGQGGAAPPTGIDQEALLEALEGPCEEYQEGAFGDVTEEDQQEFQDQFQKFAACMREEGIDVPDITPGEGPAAGGDQIDMNDPDVQAAQEKCQDELPQGGPGGGGAQ